MLPDFSGSLDILLELLVQLCAVLLKVADHGLILGPLVRQCHEVNLPRVG